MFNIPEKPKSKWTRETLERIAQENIDKAIAAPPKHGVWVVGIFNGIANEIAGEASILARSVQDDAESAFRAKGYKIVPMSHLWCFGVE